MLDRAYTYLLSLINQGVEYPDAEYRAATKFNVSQTCLRRMYDEGSRAEC
jgi:hypothetical protein